MIKKKPLDILPLVILIIALAYTLVYFDFNLDLFPAHFLGGLILTILSGLSYFIWKKSFKTILGLTLILGTMNLVKFLPVFITFGAGLEFSAFDTEIEISVQLFSLVVLLIFAYINRRRLKQIVGDLIEDKPLTEAQVIDQRERKIERFKIQFRDRPVSELTTISSSDTFDKEAVEAASRLLKERKM